MPRIPMGFSYGPLITSRKRSNRTPSIRGWMKRFGMEDETTEDPDGVVWAPEEPSEGPGDDEHGEETEDDESENEP